MLTIYLADCHTIHIILVSCNIEKTHRSTHRQVQIKYKAACDKHINEKVSVYKPVLIPQCKNLKTFLHDILISGVQK